MPAERRILVAHGTRSASGIATVHAIADAVAALSDAHLKKVPVVRDAGAMVGIVSRSAINRLAITSYLDSRAGSTESAAVPAH